MRDGREHITKSARRVAISLRGSCFATIMSRVASKGRSNDAHLPCACDVACHCATYVVDKVHVFSNLFIN